MDEQNLYYVQDTDRPMYVLATSFTLALKKWEALVLRENAGDLGCVDEPPFGIQFIANAYDIIL